MGKARDPMNVLYALGALAMGAAMALKGGGWLKPPVEFGFFSKVLIFLVAAPLGYLGAKIGDLIRKIAIPDAIFTTEGMWGIIKAKIFWFIVPQFIGLIIGCAIGATLVGYPLSAGDRAKAEERRQEEARLAEVQRQQQAEQYAREARELQACEALRDEFTRKDKVPMLLAISQAVMASGKENPEYPLLLQKLRAKYGSLELPDGRTLESIAADIRRKAAPRPTGMSDRVDACLTYRKFGLTGNALLLDERDVAELNRRLGNQAKAPKPVSRGAAAPAEGGGRAGLSPQDLLEERLGNISDMGYQLGYFASCSSRPEETATRFFDWAQAQYGSAKIAAFNDAFENGEEAYASANGRDCDRVRRNLQKLVPQLLQ